MMPTTPYWYYDKRGLRETPSALAGIDYAMECRMRREGSRFIFNAGSRLGPQGWHNTIATAVAYFHRFYMFHSFSEFPRYVTACSCLFLAGKVEETPKKCNDIIKTARSLLTDQQFAHFGVDPKEEVMTFERILLQTIKFDLQVEHPYKYILKYAKSLKGDKVKLEKMVQMAWTFANDSLYTTLCLQWEPEIIAVALLYLAEKLSKFDVIDWSGKTSRHSRWWDMFVDNISIDLLEDICHQVLDLYSTPPADDNSPPISPSMKNSTNVKSSSQTPANLSHPPSPAAPPLPRIPPIAPITQPPLPVGPHPEKNTLSLSPPFPPAAAKKNVTPTEVKTLQMEAASTSKTASPILQPPQPISHPLLPQPPALMSLQSSVQHSAEDTVVKGYLQMPQLGPPYTTQTDSLPPPPPMPLLQHPPLPPAPVYKPPQPPLPVQQPTPSHMGLLSSYDSSAGYQPPHPPFRPHPPPYYQPPPMNMPRQGGYPPMGQYPPEPPMHGGRMGHLPPPHLLGTPPPNFYPGGPMGPMGRQNQRWPS